MTGRALGLVSTRRFRLLWSAAVASSIGDQCFAVALPWLVLQLAGSDVALGGVLMTAALPRTALLVAGGALSDRVGASRVLAVASFGRACVLAFEAALVIRGAAALWQLYPLAVVWGVSDAVQTPAAAAVVPGTVRADQLNAANAFLHGTGQIGGLAAPAAAGVLIAIAGMGSTLAVSAAAAGLASMAFLMLWRGSRSGDEVQAAPSRRRVESAASTVVMLREWLSDRALRGYLVLIAGLSLATVGPLSVGLPELARARYSGSVSLGLLLSATGAGTLAGALLGGTRRRVRRRGIVLLSTSALVGLSLLALAYASSVPVAALAVAVIACASTFVAVIATSTLQARSHPAALGRLMAMLTLASVGLSPVSYLLAGLVSAADVRTLFVAASAVVALTIVQALATPALRGLD